MDPNAPRPELRPEEEPEAFQPLPANSSGLSPNDHRLSEAIASSAGVTSYSSVQLSWLIASAVLMNCRVKSSAKCRPASSPKSTTPY
ncbi:hypothetical protein [Kribbella endophytica]